MATQRGSRLQKPMLRWLLTDHQRTRGVLASSHEEWVKALGSDKGNISHSLRTLEARGWIVLGRTPGGRSASLDLTPAGLAKASEICMQL
jgi:DNA-binding MarR family transcriptional regulator